MLIGKESCTLATGHAVSALMAAQSPLDRKAGKLIQKAINDGMRWLKTNRAKGGGWSISPSNRSDSPTPRVIATYYALRPFLRNTKAESGDIVQKAISWMSTLRRGDGSLPATQLPTRAGISNTARFLSSVVRSRDYKLRPNIL